MSQTKSGKRQVEVLKLLLNPDVNHSDQEMALHHNVSIEKFRVEKFRARQKAKEIANKYFKDYYKLLL